MFLKVCLATQPTTSSGWNTHICWICDQMFLKVWVAYTSSGWDTHICSICDQMFLKVCLATQPTTSSGWNTHICWICDQMFLKVWVAYTSSGWDTHICSIFDQMFLKVCLATLPTTSSGWNIHICWICDQMFLNLYVQTHISSPVTVIWSANKTDVTLSAGIDIRIWRLQSQILTSKVDLNLVYFRTGNHSNLPAFRGNAAASLWRCRHWRDRLDGREIYTPQSRAFEFQKQLPASLVLGENVLCAYRDTLWCP